MIVTIPYLIGVVNLRRVIRPARTRKRRIAAHIYRV